MVTLTESYLRDEDLIWLLTITFAGQVWRLSSTRVEVLTEAGESLAYLGGIDDIEYTDETDLFAEAPTLKSTSFDLAWPGDVAALVALGHDLSAATGELALLRPGDLYEERAIRYTGYVSEPQHGEKGEPVALTLVEDSFEDVAEVPSPDMVVSEDTWSQAADSAEGLPYPIVFGQPGVFKKRSGLVWKTTGAPALYVDTQTSPTSARYVLVAGHATECGRDGDFVQVYNETFQEWATCQCSHAEDGLGRLVTLADISTLAGRVTDLDGDGAIDPWTDAHTYWTQWPNAGAMLCHDRVATVEGAGDLMAWMLAQASVRVDWGRVSVARDFLNRFKVSGYTDEVASPLRWLKDNLLPLIPVSLMASPDGIYPLVWRWDATARDAVADLVEGPRLRRADAIRFEGRDSVVNDITIKFALSNVLDEYKRRRTITGDAKRVGDPDVLTNLHAQESQRRYGQRKATIETDIVYDTQTADLVLVWKSIAQGFARRVVTLTTGHAWGWLTPGDIVTYTDDGLYLDQQIGIVRSLTWTLSDLTLEVVLLEDPARDRRA